MRLSLATLMATVLSASKVRSTLRLSLAAKRLVPSKLLNFSPKTPRRLREFLTMSMSRTSTQPGTRARLERFLKSSDPLNPSSLRRSSMRSSLTKIVLSPYLSNQLWLPASFPSSASMTPKKINQRRTRRLVLSQLRTLSMLSMIRLLMAAKSTLPQL